MAATKTDPQHVRWALTDHLPSMKQEVYKLKVLRILVKKDDVCELAEVEDRDCAPSGICPAQIRTDAVVSTDNPKLH